MPKTLKEVCDYLTTKCGHQKVWIVWVPWSSKSIPMFFQQQPVVISCSGRQLAEYDGSVWCYINSNEFLRFNLFDDLDNPAITKRKYLDDDDIDVLTAFWSF
ncbi:MULTISPECIES: hypothetical protein [Serratia]|uniref:Uncharacterized protein n=1 Tax=Serratia marcescens TaxID=615 RepID=A0ABD5BSB0_SERMA|nr:hypothetical protein [Serratia marcescens]MDQ9388639.1 hypothetical protein [Serratia marcescens]MDQ9405213.1 hypothetical protein [Serratia marcescens]MDQ9439833.1 hypothetical protein [Serratia marcescens]MDQ9474337.1 hypothetical protein [Serratia marcescens]MDQ9542336.1 hypothetical protein [Serratia marcescens]